jgi:hypothetical protein
VVTAPDPVREAHVDMIEDLAIVLRASRGNLSSVYATIESHGNVKILAWKSGTVNGIRGSRP